MKDEQMSNKQKNKIPYFWDQEEMHDFFSAQAQSTQEYFQSLAAEKEDRSFKGRPAYFDRLDRALGVDE